MASRRRSKGLFGISNKYLMWGLYGVAAYYGYNWWMNRQANTAQPVVIPEPTVSAFPRF